MGATGLEPVTSTVSIQRGLAILLIRLRSSCTVAPRLARYPAANVPKLLPSFAQSTKSDSDDAAEIESRLIRFVEF